MKGILVREMIRAHVGKERQENCLGENVKKVMARAVRVHIEKERLRN